MVVFILLTMEIDEAIVSFKRIVSTGIDYFEEYSV